MFELEDSENFWDVGQNEHMPVCAGSTKTRKKSTGGNCSRNIEDPAFKYCRRCREWNRKHQAIHRSRKRVWKKGAPELVTE